MLAGLAAALLFMFMPAFARADSGSTLTIDGTSDVSDSGLMQNIIEPGFHKAFPQFAFTYNGSATGAAIQNAETGNGGPSVLIVHAASLENQFLAGGYSYNNQPGYAIFTNDFVLTGANSDPAGVAANAPNNIAQAFADVAAKGAAGTAVYESRGGTSNASGTTVEEHAIWALVNSSGLTPAGVVLCTVSAPDGGGMTPINPAVQATSGQPCPDSGTVTGATKSSGGASDIPAWYTINSGTQAANVIDTNVCAAPGTGADCYTLTDRGTYDYLLSQNSANAKGTVPNIGILTRNNAAAAPGGADALINYFHAYIINPASAGETVNLAAAQAFISYLTSPAVQAQISTYLGNTLDPGGAPFIPDASPALSATAFPASVNAGQTVTVTGQLTQPQPGFPALSGQKVTVNELEAGLPVPIANGTTDANGAYSVTFTPPSSGSYQISTGAISQVENASLNPVYSDTLSPASTSAAPIAVVATTAITTATASAGAVQVSGTLGPAAPDAFGTVTLLSRPAASSGGFTAIASAPLAAGQTTYALNGNTSAGAKSLEVQYSDTGSLTTGVSAPVSVTVPANSVKVSFKRVKLAKNKLTVNGVLGQAATGTGTTVRLYALDLGAVVKTTKTKAKAGKKKTKATRLRADAASAGRFKKVATTTIAAGKTTYTIKHTLTKGHKYVLQLEFVHTGQTSSYSGYRYVTVKK